MNFNFSSFILGMFYYLILDFSILPIRRKWQKDCNYDCSICKVFDCPYKRCSYKRKHLNDNNN